MRLFVGIDPGSEVGLAVIDANSRTRHVEAVSRRHFSYSEIVDFLSKKGEPLVVATDKAKPPLLVRKVAAAFGARLFNPLADMKLAEKKEIAKGFSLKNDHEVDALAAAIYAKQYFSDTLEKVERFVDAGQQGPVKKLLITGQAPNIETAVEMLCVRKQQRIGKERLREKDKFSSRLVKELQDARQRNAALEKEVSALRAALEKKKYERDESEAVEKLRASISNLLSVKNETIRGLEKLADGDYILVCSYPDPAMKDRAVLLSVADDEAVREIEKAGAAAIISDLDIRSSLPVIQKAKANIRSLGKFLVVNKPEEESFETWLHAYKESGKEAEK
jgi:predicted RNase H-like nuclease (RuvC/YqgF family)